MKIAVVYQSHYGATETYAKWLAKDLGADLLKANQIIPGDLQQYEIIVYGGGLYASGVNGISFFTKYLEHIKDKEIYIFTVGASNNTNPENIKAIRSVIEGKLPPLIWKKAHIYHFRGAMSISKMSFIHRIMMNMMIKMLRKKPENELCSEEKDMIKSKERDADFTDYMAIAPLVADIKGM